MIKPKLITVITMDGEERSYTISRVPAVDAREIVAQYSVNAMPKVGEYKTNEAMMLKIMSYVSVHLDGREQLLITRNLIDNHVPDWETLAKIEWAMIEYNTSFFTSGKASTLFEDLAAKAQALITKTLTDLLAQSSQTDKPPSTN